MLSLTIGIPTVYGGTNLVNTIKTIRSAQEGQRVRIIVAADRTPITPPVREALSKLSVELIWNHTEQTIMGKLKQILALVETDLFMFTQDDIVFQPDTITAVLHAFEHNPSLTMAGSRILPLPPVTMFEKMQSAGIMIVDTIAEEWNGGDNYLAANGRCMSFRTAHMKSWDIPDQVVNGDMYWYLQNKKLHGTFMRVSQSIVHIRIPQQLKDQIGPSSRFQYSQEEMTKVYGPQVQSEYKIPFFIMMRSFLSQLASQPLLTLGYLMIHAITRLKRQPHAVVSRPTWNVDTSTKNI